MNREIEEHRSRIDEIDHTLLRLLNERIKLVVEVGLIKKVHGISVRDSKRENNVLMSAQKHNCGPLDERAVKRIFQMIIHESRRIEANVAQSNKTES